MFAKSALNKTLYNVRHELRDRVIYEVNKGIDTRKIYAYIMIKDMRNYTDTIKIIICELNKLGYSAYVDTGDIMVKWDKPNGISKDISLFECIKLMYLYRKIMF